MNTYTRFALSFGLCAAVAFAQQSSFSSTAAGITTEAVTIARDLGIVLTIVCGLSMMAGGAHMASKISGLVIGLVFALGAQPIVGWIASHT
jgi:type IV secretory pathway VirB2 component (pilin)